ncbi:MAG: PEP-CTERM sorting domain-containing protein [Gemmatimonadaceae bacterium]
MRKLVAVVGFVLAVTAAQDASAQTYNFNVLYNGGGNSTLAPGSDIPTGTNILPGDSFLWTIAAQGGSYWNVTTGGDFFPLMAFGVNEAGDRYGDYTLTLLRNAVSVFSLSEVGTLNNYVHLGSNTVVLPTGLQFDFMQISYALTSAMDDPQFGGDPNNPMPVNSTISGPLPIFGAPEANAFSPGIDYVSVQVTPTPEPATLGLMLTGAGLIGAFARRRRQQAA